MSYTPRLTLPKRKGFYMSFAARFGATFTGLLALAFCSIAPAARAQNFTDVEPSPQQISWQDLEFGVMIHFGPNTFLDREWGDGTASPEVFNPTQFNPEQWMQAIQS